MPGGADIRFRREPIHSCPELEQEWRGVEATASPSFFTSWLWIGTLLRALPESNRPHLLRGSTPKGTVALALCGAAITRRVRGLIRSRALSLNETGDPRFDCITIEHNRVLTAASLEGAAMDGLLTWFAGQGLDVDELRFSGSFHRFSSTTLKRFGLRCSEVAVPTYSVDLALMEQSKGDLLSLLSANTRQQLRRSYRDFERYGPLHLKEAKNIEEAFDYFSELKILHSQSWTRRNRRHSFSSDFFERFHRLLIARAFEDGGIQLLRVTAGNHLLGILYNFRYDDTIYVYQSGFTASNRRERPGLVAHAIAIQHAFNSGAKIYDFLAGSNQMKQQLSTDCEPMLWQTIQQSRIVFRLEELAHRLRRY